MTFPYTGATTGLFTRLGHAAYMLNSIDSFLGSGNLTAGGIGSVGSVVDEIAGSYASPDLNLVSGLYTARDSYRSVHGSMQTFLQSLAQSTVIQMVNDYSPQPNQTLTTALAWLIKQMGTDAQTVNKPTVSATSTPGGSNVGAGVMPVSVLGANGLQMDYVFNENITATCTTDSQSGATAGQETFTITSPVAETNALQWDYPLGSGISVTSNAVDALQDNAYGNLLQNGSFKQWTNASIGPDNWLILAAGSGVGTTIIQASGSNVYKGSYAIGFVGDGSTTPSVSQPFGATLSTAGNAGGTTATLSASTVYALNLFLKASVVPAAGVLTIDLTDGNNNTTTDAAGNSNSVSINLSGTSTSFVSHTVFFRTPAVLPTTGLRLRIRFSTACSAGTTIYFGHVALAQATQLYAGGPFTRLFSGSPNFYLNDTFTLAASNNYASKWQLAADRFFGMRSLGLQFPSSGAPTISDSLIA